MAGDFWQGSSRQWEGRRVQARAWWAGGPVSPQRRLVGLARGSRGDACKLWLPDGRVRPRLTGGQPGMSTARG